LQNGGGGGPGDVRDKTDHGNGQPEYGQQHINDTWSTGDGDLSAAAAAVGSAALSATLGVGIKEYMNVPWMPVVDIDAEPTGNSLDPSSSDRREQSGRGFTGGGAGRTGNRTAAGNSSSTARPAESPAGQDDDDDRFPYDETVPAAAGGRGNGTAGEIREPVLRPKSRFRMYRMPDGGTGAGTQANASAAATADRSFIVHLLPQRLMNMIEQAEKYARMAFSPFMWPSKERTQRALKYFPR